VFKQISYQLTGLALLVTMVGVSAPARADGELISQLEGHDTFDKSPQLNPDDYVVGRVKAVVGPILFINLLEPVTLGDKTFFDIHLEGSAASGDDVIFRKDGDRLIFVGTAHPAWISRLKLKDASDYQTNRSQIWKELDDTKEVGLPPLAPEQRTFVSEPEPAPAPAPKPQPVAPVRGLW
jgi:hypothetical protein